jgi:hypothetical protein
LIVIALYRRIVDDLNRIGYCRVGHHPLARGSCVLLLLLPVTSPGDY